mmetsp:Transcript_38490/g.80981  ORF Transcript_38490/g.80981 Transcript_38490/m.80981 type:complete len:91 (-) Transcript_38490:207-479(-)
MDEIFLNDGTCASYPLDFHSASMKSTLLTSHPARIAMLLFSSDFIIFANNVISSLLPSSHLQIKLSFIIKPYRRESTHKRGLASNYCFIP